MKTKLILIASAILLSLTSHAASTLTSISEGGSDKNGKPTYYTSKGFTENGFQSPIGVCYNGAIEKVCGAIDKEAAITDKAYTEGDHGRFIVESCAVSKLDGWDVVELKYVQDNDYDGKSKPIEMTITPCL